MLTTEQIDRLLSQGANVLSGDGEKIGSIGQVFVDNEDGQPSWVTVRTGLFGMSESFVPLAGARAEGDDIVVPYNKNQVKDAPRIDADRPLEPAEEDRLYQHYQLDAGRTYTEGTADTAGVTAGPGTDRTGAPAAQRDTTAPDRTAATTAQRDTTAPDRTAAPAATTGYGATQDAATTAQRDTTAPAATTGYDATTPAAQRDTTAPDRTGAPATTAQRDTTAPDRTGAPATTGYGATQDAATTAQRDTTAPDRTGAPAATTAQDRTGAPAATTAQDRTGAPAATGRARLRKYVTTENVTRTVPVQREEVRIEREPITEENRDDALSSANDDEREVILHEERLIVTKETVPVERVHIGTETVTDEVTINEEVRKEHIDTEGREESRG